METNAEVRARREAENCAGCRFYHATDDDSTTGWCRRYPPTWQYIRGEFQAAFAYTRPDVWCGEWKGEYDGQ